MPGVRYRVTCLPSACISMVSLLRFSSKYKFPMPGGETVEQDRWENKFRDHEKRISGLERSDILQREQIKTLVEKMDSLISWIKWFLGIVSTGSTVLFVWLLQEAISK